MSARTRLAIAGTVVAWLPFLAVLAVTLLATALGCALEAAAPCRLLGRDVGFVLRAALDLGWLLAVTFPFMVVSIFGWAGWGFRRWQARR